MSIAAESLMSLTTPIAVLPFHFRECVLIYSLARSRIAVAILTRCGSYQTLKSWLNDLPQDGPQDGPSQLANDQIAEFGNKQNQQRRWQISLNNTVK